MRWYDYAVVFFFADIMSATIMGIFAAPQHVLMLAIMLCLYLMCFEGYTKIRKVVEDINE